MFTIIFSDSEWETWWAIHVLKSLESRRSPAVFPWVYFICTVCFKRTQSTLPKPAVSVHWPLHQLLPFLSQLPLLLWWRDRQLLSISTLHLFKLVVSLCPNFWISLLYFDFHYSVISTFMDPNDWISRIFFLLKVFSISIHFLSVSFEICGSLVLTFFSDPCFIFLVLDQFAWCAGRNLDFCSLPRMAKTHSLCLMFECDLALSRL